MPCVVVTDCRGTVEVLRRPVRVIQGVGEGDEPWVVVIQGRYMVGEACEGVHESWDVRIALDLPCWAIE